MAKLDTNRLIFGIFLIIFIIITSVIAGHFNIPLWPAFIVMIFFFETHMDKKKIPNILVGGLFGMANLIIIKYFLQLVAPALGMEMSILLYILIFVFAIIVFGEMIPVILNNYAFLYFTVVGIAFRTPNFNLYLLMAVEIVGGALFIAAILGIIKIVTAMAIKRAAKAAKT
jgi:hypothetical protein